MVRPLACSYICSSSPTLLDSTHSTVLKPSTATQCELLNCQIHVAFSQRTHMHEAKLRWRYLFSWMMSSQSIAHLHGTDNAIKSSKPSKVNTKTVWEECYSCVTILHVVVRRIVWFQVWRMCRVPGQALDEYSIAWCEIGGNIATSGTGAVWVSLNTESIGKDIDMESQLLC